MYPHLVSLPNQETLLVACDELSFRGVQPAGTIAAPNTRQEAATHSPQARAGGSGTRRVYLVPPTRSERLQPHQPQTSNKAEVAPQKKLCQARIRPLKFNSCYSAYVNAADISPKSLRQTPGRCQKLEDAKTRQHFFLTALVLENGVKSADITVCTTDLNPPIIQAPCKLHKEEFLDFMPSESL